MINESNIKAILAADVRSKAMVNLAKRYYGDYIPSKLQLVSQSGRPKELSLVNWIKYICSSYSSFIFSEYPLIDTKQSPLNLLLEETNKHNIRNLENAMLYGYGLETYSVSPNGSFSIKLVDPKQSVLIMDDEGMLQALLIKSKLMPNIVYDGQIVTKETDIIDVYEDGLATRYFMVNGNWQKRMDWKTNGIPASIFTINEDMSSFFDKDLLRSIDAFNVNRSSLYDMIVSNSDTIRVLKASTQEAQQFFSKDVNGVPSYAKMLASGLITIGPDSDISDISKNIDIAKIESDLTESRNAIYMQSFLPNLEDEITSKGGVSSISGAAMELIYHPMLAQAKKMMTYYDRGMRNRVLSYLGSKGLTDNSWKISYHYAVPYNKIEYYQYAKLESTLSTKDRIESIPFIKDKDSALQNILEEQEKNKGEE